ncbi:uncharacterized protein LOC135495894 [Lineus longissimus]|uniref:uncharacterized protein LOC135495894 n=1 Tax=Lineus longissimus TaxID=88925 RepID=UPI00315CA96A
MEAGNEDDLDTHMCLTCETTIIGLENYVRHKKLECPHRKGTISKKPGTGPSHHAGPMSVDVHEVGHLHPPSHMSPSTSGIVNPNVVLGSNNDDVDKFNDFISCLALQSRSNMPDKSTEKRPNDLDLMDLGSSNLLTLNLGFSSDSDPDLSEYLKDSDDDYYPPEGHTGGKWKPPECTGGKWKSPESTGGKWKPPETHTGGKWKPGARPPRSYTGGKWKPGMGPRPISRKRARHMSGDDVEDEDDDEDADADTETEEECAPTGGKDRRTGGKVFKHLVKEGETGGKVHGTRDKEDDAPEDEDRPLNQTNETADRETEVTAADRPTVATEIDGRATGSDIAAPEKESVAEAKVDEVTDSIPPKAAEETVLQDESSTNEDSNSEKGHYCPICKDKFYNQYSMARHLLSQYHHNRAKGHPESVQLFEKYHLLILRLSPFQCGSCKFYCNSNENLKLHLKMRDHIDNMSGNLGPQLCTLCRFMTDDNDEMVEHIGSDGHVARVTELTKKRPCVIRENRKKVDCKQCGLTVHCVTDLKKHILAKHAKDTSRKRVKRTCLHCDKVFSSQISLGIHVRRRHTKEKPFTCEPCQKSYADKYTLQLHMNTKAHATVTARSKDEVMPLCPVVKPKKVRGKHVPVHYCEFCDFKTGKFTDLRPHYVKEHPNEAKTCKHCAVTMFRTTDFKNHLETKRHKTLAKLSEEGDSAFKCLTCERVFPKEKSLLLHKLSHRCGTTSKDEYYEIKEKYKDFLAGLPKLRTKSLISCPDCDKSITRVGVMQHLRTHTAVSQQCSACSRSFSSVPSLKRHIERAHTNMEPIVCEECGKRFVKSYSYRQHVAIVHRNAPKNFVCDTCNHAFASKWQLTHHSKIHGQKHLKCTYDGCSLLFRSRSDMTIHLRTHTNERPFLCDTCGYRGKSRNQLTRHRRTHTGERNFSCEYCPYKALNSTHLRRHMRVHIGSKPYKCPYCSYECNTHENIRKHIMKTKKHAGLKVYVCKFCKFSSNDSKPFRDHLVSDHKAEMKNSDLDVVSVYSGLYKREGDPKAPLEGEQVLPIKERTKRQSPKVTRKRSDKIAKLKVANVFTLKEMSEAGMEVIEVQEVEVFIKEPESDTPQAASVIPTTGVIEANNIPNLPQLKEEDKKDVAFGKYTYVPVSWPAVAEGKVPVPSTLPSTSEQALGNSAVPVLPSLPGGISYGKLRALLNDDAYIGQLPETCDLQLIGVSVNQADENHAQSSGISVQSKTDVIVLPVYTSKGNPNICPSLSDLTKPGLTHLVSLHQLAMFPRNVVLSFFAGVRDAAPPKAQSVIEMSDSKDLSKSLLLVEKARTPQSLVPVHHLIHVPKDFLSALLEIAKCANSSKTEAAGAGEDDILVYESLSSRKDLKHPIHASSAVDTTTNDGQYLATSSSHADVVIQHSLQTTSAADIMLEMAEVVLSSCDTKPSQKTLQQYGEQTYSVEDLEPSESMAIQLLSHLAQGGITTTTG